MEEKIAIYLIIEAKQASTHAYAPYSGLRVGAATIWASGKMYTGCNVENASYGLTLCAERTAIAKAVSNGERSLVAVAVASDSRNIIRPCGACLQVISEFAVDPDKVEVISGCNGSEYDIFNLSSYLPKAFKYE